MTDHETPVRASRRPGPASDHRHTSDRGTGRARIAVVGAGPAGCYTAQALRRRLPDAAITVIDRMPVPYGLIRYGVATDAQGTKAVTRQFARLFERDGVAFAGGVTVTDADAASAGSVPLARLRAAFDVVVVAHGLHRDRVPDLPGTGLPGVYGAGEITRRLNAHPETSGPAPDLGRTVAVIGMGNVAMDLARLLTTPPDGWDGTDVDDAARQAMADGIHTVHVISRHGPAQSAFDPVLARELADRVDLAHVVHGRWEPEDLADRDAASRADIVDDLYDSAPGATTGTARIEWWFGADLVAISGTDAATGVDLRVAGRPAHIAADSVITAIGFDAGGTQHLVTVTDAARRTGRVAPGLYVAGWARTGSHGTIAAQRLQARELAEVIAADSADGRGSEGRGDPVAAAPDVIAVLADAVDYAGWQRIDTAERAAAAPGRVRRKTPDLATMTALARGAEVATTR